MSTGISPGPWSGGQKSGLYGRDDYRIVDLAGRVVAVVPWGDLAGRRGAADARLVAAAPTMLSLLKQAHDVIELEFGVGDEPPATSLRGQMRALIRGLDPDWSSRPGAAESPSVAKGDALTVVGASGPGGQEIQYPGHPGRKGG